MATTTKTTTPQHHNQKRWHTPTLQLATYSIHQILCFFLCWEACGIQRQTQQPALVIRDMDIYSQGVLGSGRLTPLFMSFFLVSFRHRVYRGLHVQALAGRRNYEFPSSQGCRFVKKLAGSGSSQVGEFAT